MWRAMAVRMSQSTSENTNCISFTNSNQLILFSELIHIYSGNQDSPETRTKQTRYVIKKLKF